VKFDIKQGLNFIKYNGVSGVLSKVRYRMSGPGLAYNGWYKDKHAADEEELIRERETQFVYSPKISILVSVYMTPEFFLRSMIESVINQTYENWELCIVDGSQAQDDTLPEEPSVYEHVYSLETEKAIRQYAENDSRIKYFLLEENLGIAENTNRALAMADGDYIALLEHDDILTENALFSFVEAMQETSYDILYSDEDKMSEDGTKFSDPALKPDFSVDLLRSGNYIGHFVLVDKRVAREVNGFQKTCEAARNYDFILRCYEWVKRMEMIMGEEKNSRICHVPKVLYHLRLHNRNNESSRIKKEQVREAEKKALAAHLEREKIYGTLAYSDIPDVYHVVYETPGNPLLSIVVISNHDKDSLSATIAPLFEMARYSNFEVIIVEPSVEEDAVLTKYYRDLERIRKNARVYFNSSLSNLAEMRNFGASKAKGDYLLFLDGHLSVDSPTVLQEMVGLCMREEIGIVGGVVATENKVVTNSGIVLGLNGFASDLYAGSRSDTIGYLKYNRMNHAYTAVSASCMMVKKKLFLALDGFETAYGSMLTDVDFCLRARGFHYETILAAYATWTAKTYDFPYRKEITPAEESRFKSIFGEQLIDPYYNTNFTRNGNPFTLD